MSATPADEPAPDELPPEDGPMPAVAVCAAAPEGTPISEAAIASAQAQARLVIRISSGIPTVDHGPSDPGASYKGSGGIFKPSGSPVPAVKTLRPALKGRRGATAKSFPASLDVGQRYFD
jgi:hypothetical protein